MLAAAKPFSASDAGCYADGGMYRAAADVADTLMRTETRAGFALSAEYWATYGDDRDTDAWLNDWLQRATEYLRANTIPPMVWYWDRGYRLLLTHADDIIADPQNQIRI